MGPVFACRLRIIPDDTYPLDELHWWVASVCFESVAEQASMSGHRLGTDPFQAVEIHDEMLTLSIITISEDGESLWAAKLVRYPPEIRDLIYRVEIQCRFDGESVFVTVRYLAGSSTSTTKPISDTFPHPDLVFALVSRFHGSCFVGSSQVVAAPIHIAEHQVPNLIDLLLDPERLHPIVLISRTKTESLPLDDYRLATLAKSLSGIATVNILPSTSSSNDISHRFGKHLSCFGGATRIYWPGFDLKSFPGDNPKWLQSTMNSDSKAYLSISSLISSIVKASAIGIDSDERSWHLYRISQQRRHRDTVDKLQAQIFASSSDYESRLEHHKHLSDALLARVEEQDRVIADLYESGAAAAWARGSSRVAQASSNPSFEIPKSLDGFPNILTYVTQNADSGAILIPRNTIDMSKNHLRVQSLDRFRLAIESLVIAAYQFHSDYRSTLDQAYEVFRLRGIKFHSSLDHLALTHLGDKAVVWYSTKEGKSSVELGPHIRVPGQRGRAALSIYWGVDFTTRCFIVGHIGDRLT